jgi:hypothetical protein
MVLAALAAAAFAAWLLELFGIDGGLLVAGLLAAISLATLLCWRLTRPRPALLNWDGQRWSVDAEPGEVDVMLDFGRWMLLRFRPARGAVRWLPVPAAAQALRAALYAPGAIVAER